MVSWTPRACAHVCVCVCVSFSSGCSTSGCIYGRWPHGPTRWRLVNVTTASRLVSCVCMFVDQGTHFFSCLLDCIGTDEFCESHFLISYALLLAVLRLLRSRVYLFDLFFPTYIFFYLLAQGIPPLTAYEKGGLRVVFTFEKVPNNPNNIVTITATTTSALPTPLSEYTFLVAVPKVRLSVRASGRTWRCVRAYVCFATTVLRPCSGEKSCQSRNQLGSE